MAVVPLAAASAAVGEAPAPSEGAEAEAGALSAEAAALAVPGAAALGAAAVASAAVPGAAEASEDADKCKKTRLKTSNVIKLSKNTAVKGQETTFLFLNGCAVFWLFHLERF